MARRSRRNARRLRRAALRRDLGIERRQGGAITKLRFPSADRAPPTARPMRRAAAVTAVPSSSPRRRRLRFFGSSRQVGAPTTRPPWQARATVAPACMPRPRWLASPPPAAQAAVSTSTSPAPTCRPRAPARRTVSPPFGEVPERLDELACYPSRPRHVRGPPRVRIPPSPPTTACCASPRESARDARGEFGGQPRATPRSQEARRPPHAHASRRPRQA